MKESILETIKKMLGLESDYTPFDDEIIVHINSVFMVLKQAGITDKNFSVKGNGETWGEALDDRIDVEAVKSYVYLRVKMLFDPPSSSTVMEAMKNTAYEFEWRLYVICDNK